MRRSTPPTKPNLDGRSEVGDGGAERAEYDRKSADSNTTRHIYGRLGIADKSAPMKQQPVADQGDRRVAILEPAAADGRQQHAPGRPTHNRTGEPRDNATPDQNASSVCLVDRDRALIISSTEIAVLKSARVHRHGVLMEHGVNEL
jgi:hypothetical protein